MEQVFFRLHVRFVTTVTRLLSPKTRRVLEYVTLANAFLLVVSLAWLHIRFVNPKGGQRSAVSCLPDALERAGVDPAQLHVLQIHIRLPPDDRGGGAISASGTGSQTVPINSKVRSSSGRSSHRSFDRSKGNLGEESDSCRHRNGDRGGTGDPAVCSDGGVDAAATAPAGIAVVGATSAADSGAGDGPPLEFESPPSTPEIFYSMKLVTGKNAVGTLSGPGTLGIEKYHGGTGAGDSGAGGNRGDGDIGIGIGGGDGIGGGGLVCGGAMEVRHSTVVQTLVDAFSWGKGGGTAVQAGAASAAAAAPSGGRDAGLFTPGGDGGSRMTKWGGVGEQLLNRRGGLPTVRSPAICAATAGECAAEESDRLNSQGHQQQRVETTEEGAEVEAGMLRLQDEVYLYSLEKGFLMLRPDLRRKHGIVTANITVSAHDACLGGTIIQTLVKDFVGYDTVVMNWLISLYGGRGFLYSVRNNELFNLNYAAEFIESTEDVGKFLVFKIGVLFTTLFLFFTTTTLVSFTLRETQERMLKFTFLLQHHVRHRLPYAPLIFTHVVESLVFVPIMVGILFFLFEFFSDQLLAFMVLSVVWLCEVYSVVSVRTSVCIRFFPQVFFLYFTLFHVYFFSFPFGFSYLALITTVLFLQHSMLFCWNRYEVPALRSGVISSARPRQAGMVIGVVPRYDPHGMGLPFAPPRPTGGADSASVPAEGRQRAATASSLDPPLESRRPIIPATVRVAERAIMRSNSSPYPTPTRPSSPLGSSSHGGGDASTAAGAAIDASPAVTPRQTASSATTPAAQQPAAEWSLQRLWGDVNVGGDSGGGGGGGSFDGSGGGTARTHVSAPLLGLFPFSLRNVSHTSTPPSHRHESVAAGDLSSRAVASEPVPRSERENNPERAEVGGGTTGVAQREKEAQSIAVKPALAEAAATASMVLDRTSPESGNSATKAAATTKPPGEDILNSVDPATASGGLRDAPAADRDGGRSPSPRHRGEASSPPPGPADGAGLQFGLGDQAQQRLRAQGCLVQEQVLPRRAGDDSLRLVLGGTQRWLDDDGGNSSGRTSPQTGEQ